MSISKFKAKVKQWRIDVDSGKIKMNLKTPADIEYEKWQKKVINQEYIPPLIPWKQRGYYSFPTDAYIDVLRGIQNKRGVK
jgi:hypothetical protein